MRGLQLVRIDVDRRALLTPLRLQLNHHVQIALAETEVVHVAQADHAVEARNDARLLEDLPPHLTGCRVTDHEGGARNVRQRHDCYLWL